MAELSMDTLHGHRRQRDGAEDEPARPGGHDGAHPAHARLRARGEPDHGGIPGRLRLRGPRSARCPTRQRNEAILASDIFGLESLVDFLDQQPRPARRPPRPPRPPRSPHRPSSARSGAKTPPSAQRRLDHPGRPERANGAGARAGARRRRSSRSRAPSSTSGRRRRTGFTSSRTRASRTTTCAASSGPTTEGRYAFRACVRRRTRFRSTARPATCCK